MKVEYNGFAGELVKLEREEGACAVTITNGGAINAIYQVPKTETRYGLSIYDSEKRVTHTFTRVILGIGGSGATTCTCGTGGSGKAVSFG